jgi:hypothetical protein
MSILKENIDALYNGDDHAAVDIMQEVDPREDYLFRDEAFKKAAQDIYYQRHALAKIIKAASKGNIDTAANMIKDLDLTGDIPILVNTVEKVWENYVEAATQMLK